MPPDDHSDAAAGAAEPGHRVAGPGHDAAAAARPAAADAGAAAPPDDIAIARDAAITLSWPGGHRSRLALATLRAACPCARCDDLRRSGQPVWSGKARRLRVAGAELVGGWGLGVAWSDGHATGVYGWSLLRALCGCDHCVPPRS